LRSRAEDPDPVVAQFVREARDERCFGPDDDKVDAQLVCEWEERRRIVCPRRVARRNRGDSGVSGRSV
jgi:hypothetical protein